MTAAPLPDLAGWLVDQLSTALTPTAVSKRRPPETANQTGPWLRVTCTGGPTTWHGAIWQPTVVLEAWGDTSDDAHDLCAAATEELQDLEGTITSLMHLSSVEVFSACADAPIDGHPVCITTATATVAAATF